MTRKLFQFIIDGIIKFNGFFLGSQYVPAYVKEVLLRINSYLRKFETLNKDKATRVIVIVTSTMRIITMILDTGFYTSMNFSVFCLLFASVIGGVIIPKSIGVSSGRVCYKWYTFTSINLSVQVLFYLWGIRLTTDRLIEFNTEYVMFWLDCGFFSQHYCFQIDNLTLAMLSVVLIVSFCVHLYAMVYMNDDPHQSRFMSHLSLFTFFMIMLVASGNFLQFFGGWEGVGLCSFFLINFWYTRIQANKAALKAVIVNRFGDFGLAIAIFMIYSEFKSVDYNQVFALTRSVESLQDLYFSLGIFCNMDIICSFLLLGAVGKSAQIGLHTWLPDAMEGPTPVSALIHAATMVTAGVFLIIRCSPIFEKSPTILVFIVLIGALTSFFGASVGLVQSDLKRVIAYSTCSQLGYMFFSCGLSGYHVSFYHLSNHAFFKALLFLSAGCVIHALGDEQDMRKMGGLVRFLPVTYIMIIIGSLALTGFPFLSGFYSKDLILELAYSSYSVSGHFAFWLGTTSAFLTAFYSFRLLYLTFITKNNSSRKVVENIHEGPLLMIFPLIVLCIFSIFIGFYTQPILVSMGSSLIFWDDSIYVSPQNVTAIQNIEFVPLWVKLLPTIFTMFGAVIGYLFYEVQNIQLNINVKIIKLTWRETTVYLNNNLPFFHLIYTFLAKKWFFDKFYNEGINQYVLSLGHKFTYKNIDRGFLEGIGPSGLSYFFYNLTQKITKIHIGYTYYHLFYMFVGLLSLVSLCFLIQLFPDNLEILFYFIYFILILG